MGIPTVKSMVRTMLQVNGYDGLFSDGVCACLIADLEACGEMRSDCQAGYRREGCTCGEGCDYEIHAEPPATEND